ncbi:TonB-dependent siderophore receptor [Hyphomonas sp. CACIAM 19H1]|uniref:TonB-dependent receptor n=1 Tax=Hyphomonas sp. CACIAM 19H1 TaxID=1873716 RepID=UPI000DED6932|nr:TonB-dependent receptor [Hyphomonas sp. CACIAM 19H1]
MNSHHKTRTALLATSILTLPWLAANAQEDLADGVRIEETIVVTATRGEQQLIDVPASIAVQDTEELLRNGFTYGTDEFRGVTGVFFRRGEGDGDEFPFVSFRGSTGTEGSLSLVDGIPIIGLYEETQTNLIPYEAIDQIEIVKGPVSALYGRGALYGATNYITRNPEGDAVRTRLTAGSDDYYRGDLSLERAFGEAGGVMLAGTYEDYGGWREQGGRTLWNLFAKANADLGPDTTLSAYANYNDRDSDMPNGRPLGANGEVLPFDGGDEGFIGYGRPNNQSQNWLTALKLEHAVSDELSLSFTGSYRDMKRDVFLNFFDPWGVNLDAGIVGYNGFRGATTQKVWFGEATARWESGRHNILAGISAEQSDITEFIGWTGQNGFTFACGFTYYLVEVDYQSGDVLNANHPCFVTDETRTHTEFDNAFYGAFIQDEISLAERLTLTVGLRYDDFSRDATFFPVTGVTTGGDISATADAFSPKASLSWRTDWGQVYAAYGRGFNSNFGATFEWDPVQYARPESKPTEIDSYEIGAKGRFLDNTLTVEGALFYSEQTNRRQIVDNPDAADDFTLPSNLITFGDVYKSQGVELSMTARPSEFTTVRAAYTYLDPEWDDYSVSGADYSGNTPVGVPQNILYLQLDQQVTRWLDLRAAYEAYDDYYYTVDNAYKDGGYDLFSFSARMTPEALAGWAVEASVTNAFDTSYYSYFGNSSTPMYAMPGPPRQFRISLSGAF